MDPLGLAPEVGIEGADHNSGVIGRCRVQPHEVLAVQGHQDATFGPGEG